MGLTSALLADCLSCSECLCPQKNADVNFIVSMKEKHVKETNAKSSTLDNEGSFHTLR